MSMLVMTSVMLADATARQRFDGLPLAQRALDRGVEAVQAHAEQRGGAVVAGEQVVVSEPISGPTSPWSSPAMAAATRLATASW